MPTILSRLPFFGVPTALSIPGGPVIGVVHDEIVLWVTITHPGLSGLPPHARRFPAVLDTGFNSRFMIREQHLVEWAGLAPEGLEVLDQLKVDQQQIPLRAADVWI